MNRKLELTGQRFFRLIAVEELGQGKWRCVCDCGKETVQYASRLKTQHVMSCGCWNADKQRKHSGKGTELYGTWKNMHQRCYNPNNPKYERYGARGITVHPRWHDFGLFREDVSPRPAKHTLDRTDNDKSYGPDNFRWATPKQQVHNSSCLKLSDGQVLAIRNDTRLLREIAADYNLSLAYVSKIRLRKIRNDI